MPAPVGPVSSRLCCWRIQSPLARLTIKRSMRQLHRAGEKLFIDYAGPTLPVADPDTGEVRWAHIFAAAQGASNYTYACATPGETQVDWLTSLGQALTYFGGVPEMVVPGLNRAALECARHYDTVMLPARPRKTQAKAEVAVASGHAQ